MALDSAVIHVGVRIGTVRDWTRWLEEAHFTVEEITTGAMRLLEPDRMIRDEGPGGMLKFMFNAVRTTGAARRLRAIRAVFRAHQQHLCAVGVIARKNHDGAGGPSRGPGRVVRSETNHRYRVENCWIV